MTWVRRALQVAALPESWKGYFRERLQMMGIADTNQRTPELPPPEG